MADALFGIDNTFLTPRARRRPLRSVHGEGSRRRCPRSSSSISEHRVTPIDSGEVCVNDDLAWFGHDGHPRRAHVARRSRRSPRTRSCSWSRTRRRRRRGSRSCSRRSRSTATTGGRTTGSRCGPTACAWSTAGTQAYDTDFTASGASGDRPLVVSYGDRPRGRRRVLRRQEDDADGRCRARHVLRSRSSSRACCTARKNPAGAQGADRLHAHRAVPGGHPAPDVRVSGGDGHEVAAGVHAVRAAAGRPRRSTRTRSASTATSGSTSGRRSCCSDTARGASCASLIPLGFFGGVLRVAGDRDHLAVAERRRDPRRARPNQGLRHVAWFTLWQAVVATAITLVVGLPAAYVVARYEFPGRRCSARS